MITITQSAAVIPVKVAAATLGAIMSNAVLIGIVNRDYEDDVANDGDTVDIGSRGAVVANALTDGNNVQVQNPTTTTQSLVLDKRYEATIGETDLAKMFSRPNLMQGYAEDAGIAIVEQVEADIAALYAGLSQTIDATAGLTKANFTEAQRLLNSAKARGPRYAVLHEDAYAEASDIAEVKNADYQGPDAFPAVQQGVLGFLNGFNILLDQNIAVATAQAKNLFMARDALTLVSRPMSVTQRQYVEQVTMSEGGISVRVTLSYNANSLGEQMTIETLYGVSELRDDHGVVVSTTEV